MNINENNYETILGLFNKWKSSEIMDFETALKMGVAEFCMHPTGSAEWEEGFRPLVKFCKSNNIQMDWEDFI
jgi:hypothetical protein